MLLALWESDERMQQNVTASAADQGFIPSLICSIKSESRVKYPLRCTSHSVTSKHHGHYVRQRFLQTIVLLSFFPAKHAFPFRPLL